MKKTLFLSILLSAAMAASAQLKVAPKMQLGDQKTYASTSVVNIPGQDAITINDETRISVAEVLADGFVLSVETTKVACDAEAGNIAGQILGAAQEMMLGIDLRVATNADGQPVRITNYADVKKKIDERSSQLIDKMLEAIPQLGQVLPKEVLQKQITENTSEESLVQSLQKSSSPLALNGKTIMTGAQEDYTSDQGLKMKRMYFVNGKNVTSNGSLNMTKDEMKAMIIKQVEQMMPDQADMIKQNIDQVMDSGMLKMEMKETASYELQDDGWVKTIKAEVSSEMMGQKSTTNVTVSLQ